MVTLLQGKKYENKAPLLSFNINLIYSKTYTRQRLFNSFELND